VKAPELTICAKAGKFLYKKFLEMENSSEQARLSHFKKNLNGAASS
jgi:hypothetical protein